MLNRSKLVQLQIAGFLLVLTTGQAAAQQKLRAPSEVLHDIASARLQHPKWTPDQVEEAMKPLMAQVQTRGLSPQEDVALASAYFYSFDGLSAKAIFEKYLDRSDDLGRASWLAVQQMTFMGTKDYALVEQRLKEFRQRFRPDPSDWEYTSTMVNNLARLAASKGDHQRAVDLVLEDIRALPIGTPYRSFEALAANYESFRAAGQAAVALDWMKRHRDALRAAESAETDPPPSSADNFTLPHRKGILHLSIISDRLYRDDPAITPRSLERLHRLAVLEKLDRWISAAERGDPIPK